MNLKKLVFILIAGAAFLSFAAEKPDAATLQKQAEQGDVEAQVRLGNCLFFADGVPEDTTSAFKWFSVAAAKNDPEAQCMIGICYYFGIGVHEDTQQAILWWNMAAAQNYADAKFALSRLGF